MRLALALLALSSGCWSRDVYLIEGAALARVRAMNQTERAGAAVAAKRDDDGRAVWVKASALPATAGEGAQRVEVRARNPMVTAASILTWVGTGVSLVGSAIFFATVSDRSSPLFLPGAITALAAELPMGLGIILWPVGLTVKRPAEVPPARSGVTYLSE